MTDRRRHSRLTRFSFAFVSIGLLIALELISWPLFRKTPFVPLIGGAFVGAALGVLSMERQSHRSRIRKILGGVSDGCGFLGRDWRFVYVNEAAGALSGRDPEELVGKQISEAFPHIAELPALREVRRAMDEEIPGRFETYYAPLGRWFETNLYPTQDGVTIIVRDVSEQREAEEALREGERQLRALLDQAIAGIAQTDPEGRFLLVNERYCDIVGRSAAELATMRLRDITHPDDLTRHAALFGGLMEGGGHFVAEERFLRPGGAVVWVRKQVSAVCDSDGTPRYAFAIVEEITERKQAEAEKDQALARERTARSDAENSNRSKDEFLAVVSHELRTPLTAILGWLRLMRMGAVETSSTSRALGTIERNAVVLVRLVEDLLDVSRIISGKLELEARMVPVSPIVRAAIEVIRPAAKAKNIEIVTQLLPDDLMISGDPARLQQAVWNLLSNAAKFTSAGGRIEVSMKRRDGCVLISVQDTGIGVEPEFLPRVFDRFQQADSTHVRRHPGLGLGLAIVRHIVEMHGGTVQAESAGPGRGATFIVQLPIERGTLSRSLQAAGNGREPSQSDLQEGPLPSLRGARILLVEDEPDTRIVVNRILAWRGASVRACASAAEARLVLRRWKPDVLISDIGMPEESGYGLIEGLRAFERGHGGHIPAIALSAYAQEAHRNHAITSGYDTHVAKPVEPADLIQTVASLCSASH